MIRNTLILASLVAALSVVACDKNDGYRNDTPRSDAKPTAQERARAAETAVPEAARAPSTDTRSDQVDASVDQSRVQRDKIIDDLYASYVVATGEKMADSVPTTFKSHCDSAGKGDKVMGADATKSFFAQTDVQQKCAEAVRLGKLIDVKKDAK